MSLFKKAEPVGGRLKMYVYGESGTGKTVTALSFPSPAVIDAERGTEYYGQYFNFHKISTASPKEVHAAIDELLTDPGDFKTFVIDPFTAIYDMIVAEREHMQKIKTGRPDYTLQPPDYKYIKSEVKNLVLHLLALDMNVICTARQVTSYMPGEFMKIDGTKPEGPKELPYMFDVVIKLTKKDNKFWATVEKDRTNKLQPEFEFSYQSFVEQLGIEELEREPVVFNQRKNLDERAGRKHKINIDGREVNTAGIEAESISNIRALIADLSEDIVAEKLMSDYQVTSILDLKEDEAKLFIADLESIKTEG